MSREPLKKIRLWALGARDKAMQRLARTLDLFHVVTSSEKPGDRQGNMRGAPAGKVAWPVQPDTHDGVSFIASDAFFAEYDAEAKRVWCLDDMNGKRHTGADPLVIGTNVEVLNGARRSGKGLVVRTAEYGTKGLYKNVFIHADGDLIAHHRQPDPPHNSSLVHDPGEGPDDWAGGLHYPLRVRAFIEQFCQHKTTGGQIDPVYAPLLNMTRNGDGTVAHGAASWARGEGVLSDEALGPLAPCDDGNRHLVGITHNGRRVYESGLNISTMKLGDPAAGIVYSPVEFDKTPRVPDGGGPFWMHTHFREDMQLRHGTLCNGQQPGTKIWQTPTMFTEWGPPPTVPPETPPNDPPTVPPTEPPEPPEPPGIIVPPEPPPTPGGSPGILVPPEPAPIPRNNGPQDGSGTSAATPAEVESPSEYGHPLPTGPEEPDRNRAGATAHDQYWLGRYGVTEKEFAESPITSHAIATAVHEAATANDNASGAQRWPSVKSQDAIVYTDQQGRVIARVQPAKGPGGIMFAGADVEKSDIYTTVKPPAADTTFAEFSLGVFSAWSTAGGGQHAANGEIGIGSRHPTKAGVVKGVRTRLDFARQADADHPDVIHSIVDEEGADSATANHQFNQTVKVTTGSGDVDILDVETDATNDNPRTRVYQARTTSTNENEVTLHTFSMATAGTYRIRATIMGRATVGGTGSSVTTGDSVGYEVDATFKNVGGTVTQVGSTTKDVYEDASMGAADCRFQISGTNVTLDVSGVGGGGDTDDEYVWHMPWSRFAGPMAS